MSTKQSASGGIGLSGATFIVFLVLKLTGHIDWSWWWVTAPLWGVFAALAVIWAIFGTLWLIVTAVDALLSARRRRPRSRL